MRSFIMLMICSFSLFAAADDSSSEKTKTWNGRSMQVKMSPAQNGVVVTFEKKALNEYPKSIGMTFYDENGNSKTIELKATDQLLEAGAPQKQFSGTFSPNNQSFVGFELRIPIGPKPKIIHSEDLKLTE